MSAELDGLEIGTLATEKYLKNTGLIKSPAFNAVYSLFRRNDLSAADPSVEFKLGKTDPSTVYEVVRNSSLVNQRSGAGDAILTTDYVQDYIARGMCWTCSGLEEIGKGDSLFLTVDPTALPALNHVFVLVPPRFWVDDGRVDVITYFGSVYTPGTPIGCFNRAPENQPYSFGIEVTLNPTITDVGTPFYTFPVGGSGKTNRGGGGGDEVLPFFVARNQRYIYEFRNRSNAAVDFWFRGDLLEVPDNAEDK